MLVVAFGLYCQIFGEFVFEQWMLEYLFPGYALFGVYDQHASDQLFYLLFAFYIPELQRLIQYIFLQLGQILPSPRRPPIEHLIEDNPNRPYITFG